MKVYKGSHLEIRKIVLKIIPIMHLLVVSVFKSEYEFTFGILDPFILYLILLPTW